LRVRAPRGPLRQVNNYAHSHLIGAASIQLE
jgi:hypothetical protein